jgi:hypothetical protein
MSLGVAPEDLLTRIAGKHKQVERFIAAGQPRKRRLVNTTIVCGTIAAALTAGPAVGGQSFTVWLTKTLGLTAPAWQLLCAAAALSSGTATIATQLLKSNNIEEHVARAQACRAKLEVLEVGLSVGHMDVGQATTEYLRCVEDASFLEAGG